MTTEARLALDGVLDLQLTERGEVLEGGVYNSMQLVGGEDIETEIEFRVDNETREKRENHIAIQLGAYCVENKESGRAFHVNLEFSLPLERVSALRAWLGFLIEAGIR